MAQSVGMFQRPVEYKASRLSHKVDFFNINYESTSAYLYASSGAGDPVEIKCGGKILSGSAIYIYTVAIVNYKISGTLVMTGQVIRLKDRFWRIGFDIYVKNQTVSKDTTYEQVAEAFSCHTVQPWNFIDSVKTQSGKLHPEIEHFKNAENYLINYFISVNNALTLDKYIPIEF